MSIYDEISNYVPACAQEESDRLIMLDRIANDSRAFTRDDLLAHFSASAWITDRSMSKVVMVWHNIYKSWSWTGGHADGDRNLKRVALREAVEETGLESCELFDGSILSLELLSVPGHVRHGRYVSAHVHMNVTYLVLADGNEAPRIKPDENSAAKWMTPDEAVRASSEAEMKPIYEKLNERVRMIKAARAI